MGLFQIGMRSSGRQVQFVSRLGIHVHCMLGLVISLGTAVICLGSCGPSSEEKPLGTDTDSTSIESVTTMGESDVWEHCEPAPEDPILVGSGAGGWVYAKPPWKWDHPPAIEVAHCIELKLFETTSRSSLPSIVLAGNCEDDEGKVHEMQLYFGLAYQLRERLAKLIEEPELTIELQNASLFIEPAINGSIRIFGSDGTLLLLGHHYGGGVHDGLNIGFPLGWEPPETWYDPFLGFQLRTDLCGEMQVLPGSGMLGSTVRRMALDIVTNQGTTRVFDRSAGRVELEQGIYDVLVGHTYRVIETTCEDCMPAYASFLILRVGP